MAVVRAAVDTSAYSALRRGLPLAVEAFGEPAELVVPVVVLGELLGGFEVGTRRAANRRHLEAFLDSPRVRVVSMGEQTAECYARIYAWARAEGRPLATADLWIAASAMEHAAELLTADADFLRLPQIRVRFLAD